MHHAYVKIHTREYHYNNKGHAQPFNRYNTGPGVGTLFYHILVYAKINVVN